MLSIVGNDKIKENFQFSKVICFERKKTFQSLLNKNFQFIKQASERDERILSFNNTKSPVKTFQLLLEQEKLFLGCERIKHQLDVKGWGNGG